VSDEYTAGAQQALAAAEAEARGLGHDRLGTEHLLLGLVGTEPSGLAATSLRQAGVTLLATRHRVAEAFVPAGEEAPGTGPLPRTARAARALNRALRFAEYGGAEQIGTDHLLLGVLDVEGNAGQVLRGLGVNVDRLHATVAGATPEA
jgi:ATP-dependent Clp protease ATP-binding subunit ClpC